MRRRRRRFFRDDIVAPWIMLVVLAVLWWVGANVVGRDVSARDILAASQPSPPLRESARLQPRSPLTPGRPSATAAPSAPSMSHDEVAELRGRSLIVPVQGIEASVLRSTFDEARSGGRVHEALDIMAPRGTPVVAVQHGVVAKLFESAAGGLTVYQFDPEGRYIFYYAHLDAYAPGLHEGQQLRQGDPLGYVGTTGNAPKNAPHLHFAIERLGPEQKWWEGTPLDPFLVLK
jgi:peptidoglycan LD-endopeptidase LytH